MKRTAGTLEKEESGASGSSFSVIDTVVWLRTDSLPDPPTPHQIRTFVKVDDGVVVLACFSNRLGVRSTLTLMIKYILSFLLRRRLRREDEAERVVEDGVETA